MAEITINGKNYALNYSIWGILKAEEASGLTMEHWSDGALKSLVTLVYAGIADSGLSFDDVARKLPINQNELGNIAKTCSKELADAMGSSEGAK